MGVEEDREGSCHVVHGCSIRAWEVAYMEAANQVEVPGVHHLESTSGLNC